MANPAAKHYCRCPQCNLLLALPARRRRQSAHCPRCDTVLVEERPLSFEQTTLLAVSALLLMPFAYVQSLLIINILGMRINANLLEGVIQIAKQGNVISATMIAFCTIGAPVMLVSLLLFLAIGRRLQVNLRPALLLLGKLKEWVMLDIYLAGIIVAAIKVRDYADLDFGCGLIAFLALAFTSLIILIKLDLPHLWQHLYPIEWPTSPSPLLSVCPHCNFTAHPTVKGRCPRCRQTLKPMQRTSLQRCWAALIASLFFIVPANLLPISIVYVNGVARQDTLFSGILSLADDNIVVAIIVFVASILVPFCKIGVIFLLLSSIHWRSREWIKTRLYLLRLVRWIGRWSMLDLFVISLTMSLIDRDQLLAFTMGPAAFYFGATVVLTILAVEWLDSRLLWDTHATTNAKPS